MNSRPPLGTYRFALALIVFFAHSAWNGLGSFSANYGYVAVLCFFIVSGYLVTGAMEEHYARRIGAFALNRALRIFPAFWVSLLASVLIPVFLGAPVLDHVVIKGWTDLEAVKCASIFGALSLDDWKPLRVGWSLTVEAYFYAFLALGYLTSRASRRLTPETMCWVVLAAYLGVGSLGSLRWENPVAFIPYFCLGFSVAKKNGLLMSASAVLSLNAFLHAGINAPHAPLLSGWGEAAHRFTFSTQDMNVYFAGILGVLFFACLAFRPSGSARAVDDFLGEMTYPFYLTHWVVTALVNQYLHPPLFVHVALQLVLSLISAIVVLVFVERAVRPIRDALRSPTLRTTPAAATL